MMPPGRSFPGALPADDRRRAADLNCTWNRWQPGDRMSDGAEPYVGKQLAERTFTVTDAMLADYYGGLALARPDDGKVPSMLGADAENAYFGQIAFPNHIGHLWMRQGLECFGVLDPGATYRVTGQIRDIYPHRDRSVVYYEAEARDESGSVVVRTPPSSELPARKAGRRTSDLPGSLQETRRAEIHHPRRRTLRRPDAEDHARDVRRVLPRQRQLPHRPEGIRSAGVP